MSTGAVLQLAAYGAQDLYLTGQPQITNFKAVVKRHTNFAIETVENYFTGDPAFGRKVFSKLQRVGDLIHQIYLRIVLPELQPVQGHDGIFTSWVNAVGYAMLKSVEIQIGEQVIDTQYGQWLNIWAELSIDDSKKEAHDAMVGKHEFFNSGTQNGPLTLYIPMYFWFCRDTGSSLPLVALQQQDVYLWVEFRKFSEMWVSNARETAEATVIGNNREMVQATVLVDYIFLDEDERRFFAQNRHFYLIQQLQITDETIVNGKDDNVIELPFNHPVKELIWVLQGSNVLNANEWFNFSADIWENEDRRVDDRREILRRAVLRFEGVERFEERDALYFRLVQPYQHHTAVPRSFIYVYSFAFRPELLQPSGTANFSRIDRATLHIKTNQQITEEVHVTIYAPNYNILRIISGISGVLFRN